ncbi:uncharacterized protein CC84DRAFT_246819 [Paraphaeosphaeria sporulosa]|uniref:Uncharacterized protein n=1 Tax=Paraphaeosphaeria sporulosa TaxID=1460663 RepID=A0A177C0U1_9PLEO|nr:uncharacterized protein CC84DRAFT_246819 [Paraphaeosphaeria sporulosa]OAG00831.1 hypothetical protein CC84DRAFT_246819 [Paraphaeosphaeria sporulosa]
MGVDYASVHCPRLYMQTIVSSLWMGTKLGKNWPCPKGCCWLCPLQAAQRLCDILHAPRGSLLALLSHQRLPGFPHVVELDGSLLACLPLLCAVAPFSAALLLHLVVAPRNRSGRVFYDKNRALIDMTSFLNLLCIFNSHRIPWLSAAKTLRLSLQRHVESRLRHCRWTRLPRRLVLFQISSRNPQ